MVEQREESRREKRARQARAALRRTDEQLRQARQDLRAAQASVAQLEKQKQRLVARVEASGGRRKFDPHKQAGPKNVAMMREVFAEHGTLTAAAATKAVGSPAGHQVWAIRALVEDGEIVPTGRKDGQSVEYRFVRRKRTRLAPGE